MRKAFGQEFTFVIEEPEQWRSNGDLVGIDGLSIFCRHSGEIAEEATLCLHGFPTSSFDYRKIWPALAEGLPLIAFDMPGYGFSSKPRDFDYTTFRQADFVEAVVRHFRVERVHILAHDYGNTITQELLARRDENRLSFKIESICFLNGALFPETHRPIIAQKLLIGPLGPLFAKLITDGRFKSSLASVFGAATRPTEAELDAMLAVFKVGGGKRIAHLLIRYMSERKRFRERWVPPLNRLGVPFRFIDGLDDPVSGRHLVARFREVVPTEKDVIELPGIGHFPHLEAPETVLRAYLEFRAQSKPGAVASQNRER